MKYLAILTYVFLVFSFGSLMGEGEKATTPYVVPENYANGSPVSYQTKSDKKGNPAFVTVSDQAVYEEPAATNSVEETVIKKKFVGTPDETKLAEFFSKGGTGDTVREFLQEKNIAPQKQYNPIVKKKGKGFKITGRKEITRSEMSNVDSFEARENNQYSNAYTFYSETPGCEGCMLMPNKGNIAGGVITQGSASNIFSSASSSVDSSSAGADGGSGFANNITWDGIGDLSKVFGGGGSSSGTRIGGQGGDVHSGMNNSGSGGPGK